jgi:hypothetical protein
MNVSDEGYLIQKRVVSSKLYIYVLSLSLGRYLCWWTIIPQGYITRLLVSFVAQIWFLDIFAIELYNS